MIYSLTSKSVQKTPSKGITVIDRIKTDITPVVPSSLPVYPSLYCTTIIEETETETKTLQN